MNFNIISLPGEQSKVVTAGLKSYSSASEDKLKIKLAEAIFSRAPDEFIRRSSTGTLAEITDLAFNSLLSLSRTGRTVSVENPDRGSERGAFTAVVTACKDRPFIIDSLVELMRVRGLKHHVLLHPVLRFESPATLAGEYVSLCYIEIDRVDSIEERQNLQQEIEHVLDDVALATGDFEALISKARLARDWIKLLPPDPLEEDEERAEVGEFFNWLIEDRFLFLGYREWREVGGVLVAQDVDLGLFKSGNPAIAAGLEEVAKDAQHLIQTSGYFQCSKLLTVSSVHRRGKLDLLTTRSVMNNEIVIQSFAGQLTSRALAQEAVTIPIIRRKIQTLLDQEGFIPKSHDYKELVSLISTLPKGDLLQLDKAAIRADLQIMMGIQRRNETKVIVRTHSLGRFFAISIFMPRDRFSSGALQRIQRFLKRTFVQYDPRSGYQVSSNEDQLVALYFLIPAGPRAELPEADIEGTISELSLSWEEKLFLLLSREYGRERGLDLANLYNEIFSDTYKAATSHRDTLIDIRFLEHLTKDKPLVLDLKPLDNETWLLKIYKRGVQLSLSDLLPYLENVGFRVLNETVTLLDQHQERWGSIHTLSVKPGATTALDEQIVADVILPGLLTLIGNQAENDRLNGLLLNPGLSIRQIALLRTIGHYLWQLKELSSESTLANALLDSPRLAALLVEAFTARFSIEHITTEQRLSRLSDIKAEFFKELSHVSVLIYDRALRAMFNVVESSSRTNFFTSDSLRIALKIDCALISRMPEPRPFAEIFVCAPHFEGVHLRGGKVARGGIRWSERPDDFRTEIFGLMKTQMMKNAIIVPVGAKGGFIVKEKLKPSRDDIIACYKDYIRSLLEITDNFVSGEVIPPQDVVRYDHDDPYLVVAADKGTAAFSDIANSIAVEEFGFWLGDAFASGGSRGYNHKDFGITARGAWEAAKRHFKEVGLDYVHNPFTVVGIGDMSGDVFGNGLLLSPQVKLIAAFDHRHIFLDPNPDPGRSYAERKRLFNLPSSSWMDYEPSLISKGGGVYERNRKEILLSEEARAAIGTDKELVSGVELVQLILKAPVDLLWNGGIGTYVKASSEHNISVGDRTNDDVRVDARDLRAKIVVEGGNLGFTQRARIEFCSGGGHINTDAVDNSGGVNLSDLEVNIKILMSLALAKRKISADERNRLLGEVADRVCEAVLQRNARQAELISVAAVRSRQNLTYYRGVIEHFNRKRLLDRIHDVMPDDDYLIERAEKKQGLLRPELAILMACAKMQVTEVVLGSKIPEDPALEKLLFSYFPEVLQQRFPDEIRAHPLRREIVASQVANLMVERMGVTFLFRVVEELGASEEAIVTAFLAADRLTDAGSLLERLAELDNHATAKRYLAALRRVSAAIDNMTRWILRGGLLGRKLGGLSEILALYQEDFRSFETKTLQALSSTELENFRENMERFSCFPEEVVSRLVCLQFSGANLDLCQLAQATGLPSELLLSLYSRTAELLRIRHLLELVAKVTVTEHWDLTAQKTIESLIRSIPGQIVRELVSAPGSSANDKLNYFNSRYKKGLDRFLGNVREAESKPLTVSALLVLSNQLNGFWREG